VQEGRPILLPGMDIGKRKTQTGRCPTSSFAAAWPLRVQERVDAAQGTWDGSVLPVQATSISWRMSVLNAPTTRCGAS